MERLKAFKYRVYPTTAQKILLEKHFGAARWVYNWCLNRKIAEYTNTKKTLSKYDLMKEVTSLKSNPNTAWLKEINAQSLECAVANLDSAYTRFFREKKGFPKFKSKKKSKLAATFRQGNSISENKLKVAKFKEGIRCKFHRTFVGEIRTVNISKSSTGKYHASIIIKETLPKVIQKPFEIDKAIGIDLGVKSLLVTSAGEVFENPKNLNKSQRKLAKAQRRLTKKKFGSSNRKKQKLVVAKIYETVSNQRKDNLHKISRQLVNDNQVTTFCLETLAVSNMIKNHRLAKAISDAGWANFVNYLSYKAEWEGKNILRIGRFEPSSKTCNSCGSINHKLKLSDRGWTCDCGAKHDRDFLAACNIRDFAFAKQNLIGQVMPESKPAEMISLQRDSMKQEDQFYRS